jgi:phosphate transport system protein
MPMSKHLERQLRVLERDLRELAATVEEAVHKAIRALCQRDLALAREVVQGDDAIDEGENRIAEACLTIIALDQPVACDLRRTAAAMMINVDLESIADLAQDIAEQALLLAPYPHVEIPARLQEVAERATGMVRQSLEAFAQTNASLARQVCRADESLDRLNREMSRELVAVMQAMPERVELALSLITAAGHLEQIADLARGIAEDVVYLVEGEIVRHRPEVLAELARKAGRGP